MTTGTSTSQEIGTHSVTYAPESAQVWRDTGLALPDDMVRVDVTDCDGLTYRTLSTWDGQDFAVRCAVCGTYTDAR